MNVRYQFVNSVYLQKKSGTRQDVVYPQPIKAEVIVIPCTMLAAVAGIKVKAAA